MDIKLRSPLQSYYPMMIFKKLQHELLDEMSSSLGILGKEESGCKESEYLLCS